MKENKALKSKLCVRAILAHVLHISAVSTLILAAGFLLFAHNVTVMPVAPNRSADGIVALTGGEDRISEAVRLLAGGNAKRLLISGVHPSTNKPEIINLNAVDRQEAQMFRCCVDLDKRAVNTEANATQTTAWAKQKGFRSLIVVTSCYHMPRTLIELHQAMPNVQLIPYPVRSPTLEPDWWTDRRTTWVLGKEYVKFVTALARYAAYSLMYSPEKVEVPGRMVNARMG